MARLGDIATVITKGTTPTSIGFAFQDEGINFVKIESVDENGNFICEKFDHISDECHEKLKRSQLQEKDILFSIAGAIGRTAIVTKDILPANTNQALAIIRIPQGAINYSFLLYILQSSVILEQAEKKKQGVAQLNLSLKDIGDFIIPDIPLEEQQCIVDSLDKVSNLIFLRKQQLSKLDELAKSRFIELFGDGESPIKTVEELCTAIVDCPHTTPKYEGELKNPAIRTAEIKKGYIAWETMRYVSDEEYEERIARLKPEAGDIVYGREGTFGNAAILPEGYNFCLGQRVMLLRPDYSQCTSEYLLYAVISDDVYRQATEKNNASTVAHVNVKDVKQFKIPLPSFDKQNQFVTFVEQTDKSKLSIQQSLEKLETLKKALMQKYFG
ncbi:MAG: hypothetical protein E7665_00320 [Ruminococcaceae bacterium]|nr:hypothetical protein [Oscillospiraceae bacterium]